MYVHYLFTLRLIVNRLYFPRTDPQVAMMREMCCKQSRSQSPVHNELEAMETPEMEAKETLLQTFQLAYAVDYLSNMSDDNTVLNGHGNADNKEAEALGHKTHQLLPLKWRKLKVSYHEQCNQKRTKHMTSLATALKDIDHLIKSKKTKYLSGLQGLQAHQTLAIQSHLRIVVKNHRFSIDASERAAESHGFTAVWGSRLLRSWTCKYTKT